jgi:hypothetical protein
MMVMARVVTGILPWPTGSCTCSTSPQTCQSSLSTSPGSSRMRLAGRLG